jgi:hypothetical protein
MGKFPLARPVKLGNRNESPIDFPALKMPSRILHKYFTIKHEIIKNDNRVKKNPINGPQAMPLLLNKVSIN